MTSCDRSHILGHTPYATLRLSAHAQTPGDKEFIVVLTKAVHHVSLCVEDLDASLAFYCGLLGLEQIDRPDFGIPGAWLDAGNAQIHLIVAPEGVDTGRPPEKLSPLANHTSFAISDYQKTVDHLESNGLEVVKTSPEAGQLWIKDPSGHIIEFTERR